jgi:hypothetical protein
MTDRVLPPIGPRRAPLTAQRGPDAERPRPVIVPVPSHREASLGGRVIARVRAESARPAAIAAAARLAKPHGDALLSTATRAGVLVGVSAAVYAVSLATVAGLEAHTQSQAVAEAQPALDAIASAQAANDEIDAAVKDASARLQALASDYNSAGTDMSAYQARFQQLSALVAKIQGSAAAMNANFKLPSVTIRGAVGGGGGGSVVVTTSGGSGKP